MPYDSSASKDDLLTEAKKCFEAAKANESTNRANALDDIKFARLGEQWDERILKQRALERRPALTINKMPAFIRQVVNDSRQNKPQIKVRPVDGGADKHTADIFGGLIRNIEYASQADVAYDTAIDFAVSMGFGYWAIDFDYAHDDSFDKEIRFRRISDPFTVYADPHSTAADSSDWMKAFELCPLSVEQFKSEYKNADKVSFDSESPISEHAEEITLAKYWYREEYERKILKLAGPGFDGMIVDEESFTRRDPETGLSLADIVAQGGVQIVGQRQARSYKVTRYVLSGAEVLEKEAWPGKYIPIVPVYGDEVNIEGERYFHSLIRHAKGAQQVYNFQRSAVTEMIALEPRVPWVGPKGAFETDPNWATANTQSHPFLEYDPVAGGAPPSRTPLNMSAGAAAMQDALAANDDMKAIMGLYDASLGQRSNETSGRAIMARQKEGDVSTFHFMDNLARAVRHSGIILIDLIPKIYTPGRIVRVLGVDGTPNNAQLGEQPQPPQMKAPGEPPEGGIYNLSVGKYDVAVESGPSFTTRRQEAASEMIEFVRSFPQAAPIIGDDLIKALDWPNADAMAEKVKAAREAQGQNNPEQQKLQLEGQKLQMQAQHDQQKSQADMAVKQQEMELERQKAQMLIELEREKAAALMEIERARAEAEMEIERMKAMNAAQIAREKAAGDIEVKRAVASAKIEAESAKEDAAEPSDEPAD
ncbi:MAG: hypothetical protein KIT32_12355 [Rhodocyclaceae bacterium]|nr:hypothetical protein [Rhodocyclaceae bacterium]